MAETAPVLLVRYRPGVVKETMRTVHVVALPSDRQADVLGARCGAILNPSDLEAVASGEGMPCTACVLHCVMDTTAIQEPPGNDPDRADPTEPVPSGIAYQEWGWPVTLHRDQLHLNLDHAVSALMIPTSRCAEVIPILTQRRCLPPILAHPYAPEHHIVLTGEKYGVRLPWPEQAPQLTGTLLLPPTLTHAGPSAESSPHTGTPCDSAGKSISSPRYERLEQQDPGVDVCQFGRVMLSFPHDSHAAWYKVAHDLTPPAR